MYINNDQNDNYRVVKGLVATSIAVIVITAVALAILFCLNHYTPLLNKISNLVLFVLPGAGGGGASVILGLIALAVYTAVRQRVRPTPLPITTQNNVDPLPMREVSNAESPPSSIQRGRILTIQNRWEETFLGELDIRGSSNDLPDHKTFKMIQIENHSQAWTLFHLMMGDFIGRKYSKQFKASFALSLSFLFNSLKKFKEGRLPLPERLGEVIELLSSAYRLERERRSTSQNSLLYIQKRRHWKSLLIDTLKKEKSVLINAGYALRPSGHVVLLELTINEGQVTGKMSDSNHSYAVILKEVSIKELEHSRFIEVLFDLQQLERIEESDQYGLEKLTHYSSLDVEEGLCVKWPGSFTLSNKENRIMNSGTCCMRRLITFVKEAFGEEGPLVKLFLQKESLEHFINHVSLEKADLFVLKKIVEKFNRSILHFLNKKHSLPEEFEKEIILVIGEIKEKIGREEVRREGNFSDFSNFSRTVDKGEYSFDVKAHELVKERPFEGKLGHFDFLECEQYLKKACQLVLKIQDLATRCQSPQEGRNYARKGRQLAQAAFDSLPNPSDPRWLEIPPKSILPYIQTLQWAMYQEQLMDSGPLSITGNSVILHLKGVMLMLLCGKPILDEKVINLYAGKIKRVLVETVRYYCPTHPRHAETLSDCLKMLAPFSLVDVDLSLDRVDFSDTLGLVTEFKHVTYPSLVEIEQNPELNFVHTTLQSIAHDEKMQKLLKELANQDKLAEYQIPVSNTLHFFGESPSIDIKSKIDEHPYCTVRSLDPIRYWHNLRMGFTLFFSLNFSGTVHERSKKGPLFMFDRQNRGELELWARFIILGIKPTNQQALFRGSFLDVFGNYSSSAKEHLPEVLDPQKQIGTLSHKTQNEVLKFRSLFPLDQDLKFTPLEWQHLLSIQTYDELFISQLTGYFTQYFHRLKDPRFHSLFTQFLFSLDAEHNSLNLKNAFQENRKDLNQLFAFIKSALAQTKKLGWMEAHCFFIRILAQTTRFAVHYIPKSSLINKMYQHFETSVEEFAKENLPLALSLVASCVPYLDLPPAPSGNDLMQKILKESPPLESSPNRLAVEQTSQWVEDIEKGGENEFFISPQVDLPSCVIRHPHFYLKPYFNVQLIGEGLYELYDKHAHCYRLEFNAISKDFRLLRQIEGSWFIYSKSLPILEGFPESNHPCLDGIFAKETLCWTKEDGSEIRILKQKEDELLCTVSKNQIHHRDLPLTLLTNYQDPFVEYLARLAPKNEILCWKNENNRLTHIEFPCYGLSFTLEKGKWMSSLHPGYYLDDAQCPDLEPCPNYVVLRNPKGKKNALVSNLTIQKRPKESNTELEMGLPSQLKLMTYPLNKKGRIQIDPSGEKALYLLYVAMSLFNYELAAALIKKMEEERPQIDNSGKYWLVALRKREDFVDPSILATTLYLKIIFLASKLPSEPIFPNEFISPLVYRYFRQLKENVEFALNKEEEAFFKQLSLNEIWGTRKHTSKQESSDFRWITQEIEEKMRTCLWHPEPSILYTRPGKEMIHNFLFDYATAKYAPKEHPRRQDLEERLHYSLCTRDQPIVACRSLLLKVMGHPEEFPSVDELILENKPFSEAFGEIANRTSQISSPQKGSLYNEYAEKEISSVETFMNKIPPSYPIPQYPPVEIQPSSLLESDLAQDLFEINLFTKQEWEICKQEIKENLLTLDQMEQGFAKMKNKEPCVIRKCDRLIEGVKKKKNSLHCQMEKKIPPYLIQEGKEKELFEHLANKQQELEKACLKNQRKIEKILFDYPGELFFAEGGKYIQRLTFREFLVYFGTDREEMIYASNPSLDSSKMANLKALTLDFLLLSTDRQQINAMIAECTKVISPTDTPDEQKSARGKLIQLACSKRVYSPHKEPHLLIFEYFGKIRLRSDQYKILIEMTDTMENLEVEARTGFGKSKVLIPLWLFLKSLKNKASMMTLPASLFHAQLGHLKKILGKSFGLIILPLQFNRTQANNPQYLKEICYKLEDARATGKILLTTIQSLHGMANLKAKEVCTTSPITENDKNLYLHLRALRNNVGTTLANFFDESKECFNIRQRFDFAVGPLLPLDHEQRAAAVTIYREILKHKLDSRINFEFLPSSKGITPLKNTYREEILPELAKVAVELFTLKRPLKETALCDLQGKKVQEIKKLHEALSKKGELLLYARIRKHLTIHLKDSLCEKSDDSYGFAPNSRLAIPWYRESPLIGSSFSDVDSTLDYTIQANLKKDFPQEEIEQFFDQLKVKKLMQGLNQEEEQFVKKITRGPLLELKDKDYQEITKSINQNNLLKLLYIEYAILPELRIYKHKVTNTSFNLIRSLHHVQAGSGTVNRDITPPSMRTIEDETAVIENLQILWAKSQYRIGQFKGATPQKKLKNALNSHSDHNVLIDIGGSYRELSPIETAQIILKEREGCLGVVFYDSSGREMIYDRATKKLLPSSESALNCSQLFIFIRKSKVIGTDTKMLPTVKAIVTVSHDTSLDLFFQGSGRMRMLPEGQLITYLTDENDFNIIFGSGCQKPTLEMLVSYLTVKQGMEDGEDAFYVLQLYLEDLVDSAFWKMVEQYPDLEELQLKSEKLSPYLKKATQTNPINLLNQNSEKMNIKEAIEQLKKEILDPLKSLGPLLDSNQIREEFDRFVDYNKYPQKIDRKGGGVEISHVEVEENAIETDVHEEEVEETTVNLHAENNQEFDLNHLSEMPELNFNPMKPLEWDGDYVTLFKSAPNCTLLGIPIYYSPNFEQIAEEKSVNRYLRKPAYQYLICVDEKGVVKMALLDMHDAVCVKRRIEVHKQIDHCQYVLRSGDSLIAHIKSPKLEPHPSIEILQWVFLGIAQLREPHIQYLSQFSGEYILQFIDYCRQMQQAWPHIGELIKQCEKLLKN